MKNIQPINKERLAKLTSSLPFFNAVRAAHDAVKDINASLDGKEFPIVHYGRRWWNSVAIRIPKSGKKSIDIFLRNEDGIDVGWCEIGCFYDGKFHHVTHHCGDSDGIHRDLFLCFLHKGILEYECTVFHDYERPTDKEIALTCDFSVQPTNMVIERSNYEKYLNEKRKLSK